MSRNPLRFSPRAPISIGLLLAGACAQSGTSLPAQAAAAPPVKETARPAPPPSSARTDGLPGFMLPVPGGAVEMGLTSDALLNSAAQVVSPTRPTPAMAAKISTEQFLTAMRRSASTLGRRKVDVPEFLLAKWPVKCSEYATLLEQRRAQGIKMRPPFGWWRFGCPEDYAKAIPEITKQFPGDKDGPVLYWERHGGDLPFALKDDKGRSIADLPVTFVSYREANDFAAAFGMRLPSEAEYTRAARGDGSNIWPWGQSVPAADVFSEDALKQMRLYNSSDKVLKPVGTVPACAGPYGHFDMYGQVWQFVSGLGYRPINGVDAFTTEWKALQKDKVGALLQAPPPWKDDLVLGKGGSYLSAGEPIQLLIDARAKVQTVDAVEGIGFRLAKSLRPGYDLLYSLLRGVYNRAPFATDQDIDLASQVGAERYELGPDGFPTSYQAVSFAPVDSLTSDKTLDLAKLIDKSQTSPLLVGTFATTVAMLDPAVPAGHYSVLYRKEGMPRELVEAIKTGHKEVGNGKKPKPEAEGEDKPDKPKDDKAKDGKKPKEQEKKASWREIVTRFGITDEDLASKDAAEGLKYIRIDGLKIPTHSDCFLLHGNDGKVVAVIPATQHKPGGAAPFPPELAFEANAHGKMVTKLRFGPVLCSQNPKKVVDFHLHLTLDRAMPAADAPWRMPAP